MPLSDMPDSIEERIRQAIQEGKFDALPGKGKPLYLDENPHEDPSWRLAYHVLRSSGYTLPWIAARQDIETEIEVARQGLRRAWAWRQEALQGALPHQCYEQVEAVWQGVVETFGKQAEGLNKRIFAYNLEAPLERFQLRLLKVEQEIALAKGLADR